MMELSGRVEKYELEHSVLHYTMLHIIYYYLHMLWLQLTNKNNCLQESNKRVDKNEDMRCDGTDEQLDKNNNVMSN